MIIDFALSNFRSFRDEQLLSLVAERKGGPLRDNITVRKNDGISIFRSAGVYGANASGKTNLMLGIEALRFMTDNSGFLRDGQRIPVYEPFRLSEENLDLPVKFEIEFTISGDTRFKYEISFNQFEIINESLDFYPNRVKANIFQRDKGMTWQDISFGNYYKGGSKRIPFFQNNSYLAKAGNSADSPEIIRNVYNYFRNNIVCMGPDNEVIMLNWMEDLDLVNAVKQIISHVDTGIVDLKFEDNEKISSMKFPENMPDEIKERFISANKKNIFFIHKGKNGKLEKFSQNLESVGTVRLLKTLPFLVSALRDGETIFFDELESSIHPHVAELIIKLFNDKNLNKNNAQIIYSTHNISLMSPELMRRDQIWLVEKKDGESQLYSLDEFDKSEVKFNSPYDRWYDEGRFGAVPRINYKAVSEQFDKLCNNDA